MAIYQNQDLSINRIFVSNDLTQLITDMAELKHCALNPLLYYSSTGFPVVDRNNMNKGSVFKDYFIPTGAWKIQKNNDQINLIGVEKTLSFTQYVDLIFENIKSQIQNIYKDHKTVTLFYSGGIDSMVVLSYIISLGLLSRTRLLHYQNTPTSQQEKYLITQLLERFSNQVQEVDRFEVTVKDVADIFNRGSLSDLLCYSSKTIFSKINQQAIITGHHGNQILLHKDVFVDEILLSRPDEWNKVGKQKLYTDINFRYDPTRPKVKIDDCYMLIKPWENLCGINQNVFFNVLGSSTTFEYLRKLDFSTVDVLSILDAQVAREIMNRNTDDLLTEFIETEDTTMGDSITPFQVPLDFLDKSILQIPTDLHHDANGLEYIQTQIDRAYNQGYIYINDLVTIKTLNHIGQL